VDAAESRVTLTPSVAVVVVQDVLMFFAGGKMRSRAAAERSVVAATSYRAS
jgi:hypothetical protein